MGHCDVVQFERNFLDVKGAEHRGSEHRGVVQGAGYHNEVRGLEHVGKVRGAGQERIKQGAGHDENLQNREV